MLERIEDIVTEMGFRVQKKNGKVNISSQLTNFNIKISVISNINYVIYHRSINLTMCILMYLVESNSRAQATEEPR